MKAQVDQKFSSGFVLTEEGLLKLVDIIRNRLCAEDGTPIGVQIDVKRADHALITHDDVAGALGEENGKIDHIQFVNIYSIGSGDEFSIVFEKGEKSALKITSESRDRALLALSDLREYMKSEVVIKRLSFILPLIRSRLTFPLVMVLSMISAFVYATLLLKRREITPPIHPDVSQKIDYLYRTRVDVENVGPSIEVLTAILVFPIIALLSIMLLSIFMPYIYQTDVFVWGKEKDRIRIANSIREKVFWTIGIGLLVSVVSGFFIEYMK